MGFGLYCQPVIVQSVHWQINFVRSFVGTLSGFVCHTDTEFIETASGRIIADIAISGVELGLCAMTLGLLLYCWKRDDKYKRIIHAVCEYACLVRNAFQVQV